jgi:nucleotide-binding universal stress UspA family protein
MSLYTSVLKKVLVATDLSSQSNRAVERALQLAAARGAELNVVCVMEEGLPREAQAEITAANENAIRETLAASPFVNQVKVTIDLVVGNAATDIVERAVIAGADCIVLGLHDRLLAENLPIEGTLAETVIGGSALPVLLVRNEPLAPYQTAVVGIDFSPLSHAAVQAAVLIAPMVTLHLVHAYEGESDQAQMAEQRMKSFVSAESGVFERAALQAGLPELVVRTIAEQGDPRPEHPWQNRLDEDAFGKRHDRFDQCPSLRRFGDSARVRPPAGQAWEFRERTLEQPRIECGGVRRNGDVEQFRWAGISPSSSRVAWFAARLGASCSFACRNTRRFRPG